MSIAEAVRLGHQVAEGLHALNRRHQEMDTILYSLNRKRLCTEVRMHSQERWSMLFLSLVLLPAVLLPAAQKQDKATSSERNTVEGA